jgi:DNA mismatch repair protein MutS
VTTPLRRQYLEIKRRYPHAIVFFRLGDFYETFDEDAEVVARELEITLTSRPVSKGERVPLAGVPHHSLDSHLAKLISRGYKVAICEQVEPATPGKKLVDRQVVRVVTPGTLIEDNLLPGAANNFLASLIIPRDGDRAGLAYVDISTGEFRCLEGDVAGVWAELGRLAPAELLVTESLEGEAPAGAVVTTVPNLSQGAAAEALKSHLGLSSLDSAGLGGSPLAAAASGVVIIYLGDNQAAVLPHITRITVESPRQYMFIDGNTQRNLELFSSLAAPRNGEARPPTLVSVLDRTKTAMGARLLRRWMGQPLTDVGEITRRQEQVQYFFDSALKRARTGEILGNVADLERAATRISTAASASPLPTTPRDLLGLRRSLEAVSELRAFMLSELEAAPAADLRSVVEAVHPCSDAVEVIAHGISDDPQADRVIRAGFSAELDELRGISSDARQLMVDVERRERERTGIKSLKVGYNRVFGYYIEVSKANAAAVPDNYQRKQTLVGGERYTTPELREIEYKILHARERQDELADQLLRQVCAQVAAQTAQVLDTAKAVAQIDLTCALAEVAARNGYVRPAVDDSDEIVVRDGRHPVVEEVLESGEYVPNDIDMSTQDTQIIVLTGPNMAGKSTYLRQVALIVLMAQMGSFVPAAEARIGIVDRLFSRVGALDDIATGRSTFMVEMLETAAILHNATSRSLLIFDEIGRGTSTYDGMAIARAVVEFVHNRPDAAARCLFATHYHELTELASLLPRVKNYHVAVAEDEGRVVFLHRILPGGADRSYGVHVAQLAGLPQPVIVRAQEILDELERGGRGTGRQPRREEAPSLQMALFNRDDGLAKDLSALDVDSLTPLQAITKLYELTERARRAPPPP